MGRGALTFKGEKAKKKKKKSKPARTLASVAAPNVQPQKATPPPKVAQGTGTITSSGTVLTGHGTKFDKELSVGDAILVQVHGTSTDEMRVVTMCLSSVSINVSSAFSKNIMAPLSFRYIRKPRLTELADSSTAVDDEEQKFGTYRGTEVVTRERTEHGNYRIQKTTTNREFSRTELLSLRSKKTSDKYC